MRDQRPAHLPGLCKRFVGLRCAAVRSLQAQEGAVVSSLAAQGRPAVAAPPSYLCHNYVFYHLTRTAGRTACRKHCKHSARRPAACCQPVRCHPGFVLAGTARQAAEPPPPVGSAAHDPPRARALRRERGTAVTVGKLTPRSQWDGCLKQAGNENTQAVAHATATRPLARAHHPNIPPAGGAAALLAAAASQCGPNKSPCARVPSVLTKIGRTRQHSDHNAVTWCSGTQAPGSSRRNIPAAHANLLHTRTLQRGAWQKKGDPLLRSAPSSCANQHAFTRAWAGKG